MDITRSEEELQLSSTWRPVERLRVRKRVVSEERTVTLTLRREELVVEQEPVRDGPVTLGPPPPVREPLVVTVSEEQAVITTRVVPVEQVRVVVEGVVEEHEVRTELRSERIDVVPEPLPPRAPGA